MTPTYRSTFYPFPIDLNEDDHDHDHYHQLFAPDHPSKPSVEAASSSSSLTYPIPFINSHQEEEGAGYYHMESQPHQEMADSTDVYHGVSWDHKVLKSENDSTGPKFSLCKKEHRSKNQSESSSTTVKWMSSKMRLMRKMMNLDQTVENDIPEISMEKYEEDRKFQSSSLQGENMSSTNNCSNTIIRVCADCNTTKTPLWRSGPRGPKSLCNACGIRQRKARRAMAAEAAVGANGTFFAAEAPTMKSNKVQQREKKTNNSHLPFKKRCKFTTQARGRKKLCFDDLSIILSKNSAFQRVFPPEEKEAAILLMALSYGLVHG